EQFGAMSNGQTDATGSFDLKMESVPKWLTASKGDDAFAMRMGEEAQELPMAAFRLPIDYAGWAPTPKPEVPLRGFIFTDRPLYRPGEVAHVKGYLRRMDSTEIGQSAGIVGKLKITDPRGRELPPIEVKTDERGAFDTVLQLGEENTGTFWISLEFPDAPNHPYSRSARCNFLVADFQPNAFEVEMNIPARIAPGGEVKTKVSAKYLFGAPITKADVRWTLQYVSESFSPDGFYGWQFGDAEAGNGKMLTLRGEGSLDGAGGFPIEPALPAVTESPGRGVLTAEITDLNQQTVSEKVMFTRDASEFYLGQETIDGIIFRPGEDIVTRAIAVKADGEPLSQPVAVEAELLYVKHDTVRVQGAGKAISFRTEKTEESVAKGKGQTLIPRLEQDTWKAEGETVRLKATKAGQYKMRLTATDASGRKVVSVLPIFVSGADEIGWDYRNPAQVDLIADKEEYKAGDTARIMVKAPISGEAWVSIERDRRVLRTMLVKLEGNAPVIEVPLKAEDFPNVYVSMVLVRGLEQSTRQFKMPEHRYGATMLRMTDPLGGLRVEIKPANAEVQPRDEVVSTVLVTNGSGAPVRDAEVTFFAVDDGILALTGYDRPQPGEIFTQPFPLAIRMGISL
ncbi:MAG TPA: MG2 domain-containing protein, partial [Chthoniobacteraceae bacterium]|nr:MG2 domain-containing protein [Chthoniobacteraceae bacterium]